MSEIKVGDRVRFTATEGNSICRSEGRVHSITGSRSAPRYTIHYSGGTALVWPGDPEYTSDSLELITPEPAPVQAPVLTEAQRRKNQPMARGCLDYFGPALAAVAELSRIGGEQHHPGAPMHWDYSKSADHSDCLLRHLMDRGTPDTDGISHTVKVAWRALALLQSELEAADPALHAKCQALRDMAARGERK